MLISVDIQRVVESSSQALLIVTRHTHEVVLQMNLTYHLSLRVQQTVNLQRQHLVDASSATLPQHADDGQGYLKVTSAESIAFHT